MRKDLFEDMDKAVTKMIADEQKESKTFSLRVSKELYEVLKKDYNLQFRGIKDIQIREGYHDDDFALIPNRKRKNKVKSL